MTKKFRIKVGAIFETAGGETTTKLAENNLCSTITQAAVDDIIPRVERKENRQYINIYGKLYELDEYKYHQKIKLDNAFYYDVHVDDTLDIL